MTRLPNRRDGLRTLARWAGVVGVAASGWRAATAAPSIPAAALPLSASLADELRLALARQQPLVVMVSLPGCPFCHVVRHQFLLPMQASDGLAVVQVDMRSTRPMRDATGRFTAHGEQVRAWGVRIAPTLLFLGPGGHEVAERMVGAMLPDYYGAYLLDRLEAARPKLAAG